MRQFTTLLEAIPEIQRDLTRATPQHQRGLQQRRAVPLLVREALNYSYSLPLEAGNITFAQFSQLYSLLPRMEAEKEKWSMAQPWWDWFEKEMLARESRDISTLLDRRAVEAHPLRESLREGSWPSYTYAERLRLSGGLDTVCDILREEPYSRRAYLPIFLPEDALRATSPTRVPCSLGFHFLIRSDGQVDRLHVTYDMRACDFSTFWLTDVLLATEMGREVALRLQVETGLLVHQITSLHLFEADGGPEVY